MRKKPVYVLSSDTLVETPVIVHYIDQALTQINKAAQAANLPIVARKVVPNVRDSFWVNLLGTRLPGTVKPISLVYRATQNRSGQCLHSRKSSAIRRNRYGARRAQR